VIQNLFSFLQRLELGPITLFSTAAAASAGVRVVFDVDNEADGFAMHMTVRCRRLTSALPIILHGAAGTAVCLPIALIWT
jgi:hypothetical protein